MENWKDIPGYEGLYQVSDHGRVKCLSKKAGFHFRKVSIMKPKISSRGYEVVTLVLDGKYKYPSVHQLVAMAFLGHVPNGNTMVVDHINNDPLDNRLFNLQIVTNRFNVSKDIKNKTSKYSGVSTQNGRWKSQAVIKGIKKHIGMFTCETAAMVAYQKTIQWG